MQTLLPLIRHCSIIWARLPSGVVSLGKGPRQTTADDTGGRRHPLFNGVIEHHVDVVVEPPKLADDLLVAFHDDPDLRPDAFVQQL